ncbi:MAG: orotidine-5'-phosphate decarboxylase [Myxococcales bacterium]|nr:orotidine-5'-phosphate decarboxylase [Myxococcales bacterium]
MSFQRLARSVAAAGTPLCVGIDPHPGVVGTDAGAVLRFGRAVIAASAGRVPAVKPQFAFYEALGWQGMRVLATLCEESRDAGLIVVADAKRGDIGTTAAAYAGATLGPNAPFPADILTVSPFLGLDTLGPFVTAAREHDRAIYVLLRTSNAGSATFQDPAEEPLCAWLRDRSNIAGAVVGATHADAVVRLRARLPLCPFLLPGYGAQGGSAETARAAFIGASGAAAPALVVSARGATLPDQPSELWRDDPASWIAARIDLLRADLARAGIGS